MLTGDPDVHIEVSSPGLNRVIKNMREYRIFLKRGLAVLAEGQSDWARGILTDVTDRGITLTSDGAAAAYAFGEIRKAKLDTQEDV
jgi:ribosome maturation factor RimP